MWAIKRQEVLNYDSMQEWIFHGGANGVLMVSRIVILRRTSSSRKDLEAKDCRKDQHSGIKLGLKLKKRIQVWGKASEKDRRT